MNDLGHISSFPTHGGNVGALIRAHDWAATALGPIENWCPVLRTSVNIVLASPFPAFIAWGTKQIILYNDAYADILFSRHPSALGQAIRDVWPEAWDILEPLVHRTMIEGESSTMENLPFVMHRKGYAEETWFTYSYAPVRADDGRVLGLLCNCLETTEGVLAGQHRDAAEADLLALNNDLERQVAERTAALRLFSDIVQSDSAPVCAFDHQFRLIAFNRAHSDEFFRIYGIRVKLGDVFPDLFLPEQGAVIRGFMARALAGESFTVTEEFGDPELIVPYWEVSYNPLRNEDGTVVAAFHHAIDITARLRVQAELAATQEALRQSQKMEAVGQLTGGLAHDFNNLLAGISGSLELMQSRTQQGRFSEVDRYIVVAQGAAKRAAALTHRLLAFSRRQTLAPEVTDVNRLVAGMQELIQRTVGPSIIVEVIGLAESWPILVDPSQLENALLNLCINARDAMPEGGRITIETANSWLDENAARQRDLAEGHYLSLSVTDTGTGMPREVIERAFEPFFTTKPLGQGTGLGLSMIYGFTRQSGGQTRIYSEVGQGTTVSIYLPRHHGRADAQDPDTAPAVPPSSERGKTVLVVDDEATVRMLITDTLDDLGHTAIEAEDSLEGLRILQSDAQIDLLVTDVGLPGGMNGRQMADAARALRPTLQVLFITGYAENAALNGGQLGPGMAVLTKPFAIETMAARIRSMVETKKSKSQNT